MKTVEIPIDDYVLKYLIDGSVGFGGDDVLLQRDDDLTGNCTWHSKGYTIAPFLEHSVFSQLHNSLFDLLRRRLGAFLNSHFQPSEMYHYHHVFFDDALHRTFIERLRKGIALEEFPINVQILEKRISEICKTQVTACNPWTETQGFFLRIIRPAANQDYNPPHRDVWLDHLRNAINIYLPLSGSNTLSSLPLAPGSHFWKESEIERTLTGCRINQVSYTVPSVTGSLRPLTLTRPNPKINEVLVFSPYLIHGGGINLNPDMTRISLEMRFWRA